jgi:1-acyl-sn-glycerol-3-phosphate acyltransferase
MFPEGTRSRDGSIGKVHSGAAVIAANHDVDIVPIYVSGTHDAMPPGQNWPQRVPGRVFSRRHPVEVRFGEPISPRGVDQRREVMDEVRAFWDRKGLPAAPDPKPSVERESTPIPSGRFDPSTAPATPATKRSSAAA